MRPIHFFIFLVVSSLYVNSFETLPDSDESSRTETDDSDMEYELNHTIILTYPYKTVQTKPENDLQTSTSLQTTSQIAPIETSIPATATPKDLNKSVDTSSFLNFNVSDSLTNQTSEDGSELIGQLYSREDFELVRKQIESLLGTDYAFKNESSQIQSNSTHHPNLVAGVFANENRRKPKMDLKSLVPLDKLINSVLDKQKKPGEIGESSFSSTTKVGKFTPRANSTTLDKFESSFKKQASDSLIVLTSLSSSTTSSSTPHTRSSTRPAVSIFKMEANRAGTSSFGFRISTTTKSPLRVFEFSDPKLLMNSNIYLNGRNFTVTNVTDISSGDSFDAFHYIGKIVLAENAIFSPLEFEIDSVF
jgi:hypothetical protein